MPARKISDLDRTLSSVGQPHSHGSVTDSLLSRHWRIDSDWLQQHILRSMENIYTHVRILVDNGPQYPARSCRRLTDAPTRKEDAHVPSYYRCSKAQLEPIVHSKRWETTKLRKDIFSENLRPHLVSYDNSHDPKTVHLFMPLRSMGLQVTAFTSLLTRKTDDDTG